MFARSGQFQIIFLQRVMKYDLFVKRGIIFRELVAHRKKSFICILMKYRYILHTLLLIRDFLVRPMMTYL